MENDTVRTLGDDTFVDIWIEGKSRAIVITRDAIETYLGLGSREAAGMDDSGRCEFVRTNLGLIVRSATHRIHADPQAAKVRIEAGQLLGKPSAGGERRSGGDRRKGDRRQRNLGPPAGVERRR
jgi:hypothetical protein